MCLKLMSIPFDSKRIPVNRWNNDYIQPGNSGSVGDVNVTPRLRNSDPMMPVRFDDKFINSERLGANVQNGDSSNVWGSQWPQIIDGPWNVRTGFRTSLGWIHQDLRAPDKLHEPTLGEMPQYSWDNMIATNYNAMRTGNMFLPTRGGYNLDISQTPRGGQIPRIVDTETGDNPNFSPVDNRNLKDGEKNIFGEVKKSIVSR